MWLERHYECNIENEPVGFGAISTEHSVMCSNFAVDGDEITHIKRLLTEIYPDNNFSMVSDSYDYENLVMNLLPQCKAEIMAHNGTLLVRGDSGNPVEILAGKPINWLTPYDDEEAEKLFSDKDFTKDWMYDFCRDCGVEEETVLYFHFNDKFYALNVYSDWTNERGAWTDRKYYYVEDYAFEWEEIQPSLELMGTVWALDQIVGHTVNEKGYKVLDSHLKAIYGDSILPDYANEIYKRLAAQGYAANNVVMDAGSMSMMALVCADDEGTLQFAGKWNGTNAGPYTRDTFGIAVKATYAENERGQGINIFKRPKALAWKKSQKGCCVVAMDGESYTDGHAFDDTFEDNLMEVVFCDGKVYRRQSLAEIREKLWG
jgi:nicotinamide phosphoribosyltransferase